MRLSLVLCALALVACQRKPDDPKAVAAEWCKAHYDILMRWITSHGRYPEHDREINAAAQAGAKDPWGNDYFVEVESNDPRIWSWGPDGEQDTEDDICYPPLPD